MRQISLPVYLGQDEYTKRLISSLTEELQRLSRRTEAAENALQLTPGQDMSNTAGEADLALYTVYDDPFYWATKNASGSGDSSTAGTGPAGADATYTLTGLARQSIWYPQGNGTFTDGPGSWTVTGTSTTGPAFNLTSVFNQSHRLVCATATTADAICGVGCFSNHWLGRSSTSLLGGMTIASRFGFGNIDSSFRWFCGVSASSSIPAGSTNPSSVANIFGIGQDASDTNIQLIHGDAGTTNKTNLGASFPRPTASTDWFEVVISCEPGTTTMEYTLTNKATGATTSGSTSTTVPASGTRLYFTEWIANGSSGVSAAGTFGRVYIETKY